MTAPQHVLLDFFGTLVAYSESLTNQGFHGSHRLVCTCGARLSYTEFLESWAGVFEEFEEQAQRTLDEYAMDAVCAEFLARVLPRDPDDETLASFRDTYLSEWNKGVTYLPGVRELLSALSRRFVLVVVTNTHHAELVLEHLREMNVAEYFAGVVTSVEYGKRKPAAGIFDRALAETGGSAATATYVGDSFVADYRGAMGAGLRCLLIDPERRHEIPEDDRVTDVFEAGARLMGWAG